MFARFLSKEPLIRGALFGHDAADAAAQATIQHNVPSNRASSPDPSALYVVEENNASAVNAPASGAAGASAGAAAAGVDSPPHTAAAKRILVKSEGASLDVPLTDTAATVPSTTKARARMTYGRAAPSAPASKQTERKVAPFDSVPSSYRSRAERAEKPRTQSKNGWTRDPPP
jgi:hypothetical protein